MKNFLQCIAHMLPHILVIFDFYVYRHNHTDMQTPLTCENERVCPGFSDVHTFIPCHTQPLTHKLQSYLLLRSVVRWESVLLPASAVPLAVPSARRLK